MAFTLKSTNPHKGFNNTVLENNLGEPRMLEGLQIVAGIWTSSNTSTAKLTDIAGNTLKFTSVAFRHCFVESTGAAIATTLVTETDGTVSVSLTSPTAVDYNCLIVGILAKQNF